MLDQQVLHVVELGMLFGLRKYLDRCGNAILMRCRRQNHCAHQRPKRIRERPLVKIVWLSLVIGKFVTFECLEDLFVLSTRHEFKLAKLHRLETARGI